MVTNWLLIVSTAENWDAEKQYSHVHLPKDGNRSLVSNDGRLTINLEAARGSDAR
jgi:hypothetical protein